MRRVGRLAPPHIFVQGGGLDHLVAFVSPAMAMATVQYSQCGGQDHRCMHGLTGGSSLAGVSSTQPTTQKVRCVHGFSGDQAKLNWICWCEFGSDVQLLIANAARSHTPLP